MYIAAASSQRWRVIVAGLVVGAMAIGCKRDTSACDAPGQCALMTTDCCGAPCDATASDFSAVNVDRMHEFRQDSCDVVDGCDGLGCTTPTAPRFLATCRDEQCVVQDTADLPLSACSADEDCILRFGLGCCEPCSGEAAQLTSVRADGLAELAALTCAPDDRCGGCFHDYPPGATAVCVDGRCSVSR